MYHRFVLTTILSIFYVLELPLTCMGIIGGNDADIKQYPFQLALLNDGNETFCGATLISSQWALTSARCIINGYRTNLSISAGSSDGTTGQEVLVNSFIVHHKYIIFQNEYNIALLELEEPVKDEVANPVQLPDLDYELPEGTIANIVGWGRTSTNDTDLPSSLQEISLPLIDHQTCEMDYLSRYAVMNDMICFGIEDGGAGVCDGDFGGSATVNGVIYGIAAYGKGCALANNPTIFTKVSTYLEWIQTNCNNCIDL